MNRPKISLDILSSEEEIAIDQLDRLKEISRQRLLTSEEVKMYDLLVKNLRLIKDKPDVINTTYVKLKNQNEGDLLAIASGIEPTVKKDE